MTNSLKVFKFGGASVKDAASVKNVASILQKYSTQKLVIVVSAMGKTTNAIEKIIQAHAQQTGEARDLLEQLKQQHYQIINELVDPTHEVYDTVNDIFVEIDWVLDEEPDPNYDFLYDQMIGVGELVSTTIVAAYLNHAGLPTQWVDARGIIRTDDIYREAWVQWDTTMENMQEKIKPLLEKDGFVLTQGFIASTEDNYTTSLGREGSDYTAAIFSYCLDAESMSIWKDVKGVLTADPRKFKNVTKLDFLSYREAIEMTYYGAKVIHPKTIKPLQNKNIPLFVKSFIEPEGSGTCIKAEVEDHYPPMVAIETNQALIHISTRDFSFVAEHHLKEIFDKVATCRLNVHMMQNTAISFSICVTDIDDRVERFCSMVQDEFNVVVDKDLELITIRHYQKEVLNQLRHGKIVLLEGRIRRTVQIVVKDVPILERIE